MFFRLIRFPKITRGRDTWFSVIVVMVIIVHIIGLFYFFGDITDAETIRLSATYKIRFLWGGGYGVLGTAIV